jgi:hypothetical protein
LYVGKSLASCEKRFVNQPSGEPITAIMDDDFVGYRVFLSIAFVFHESVITAFAF